MKEWKNIWVHGLEPALEAWIEAKKIDDGNGGRTLPHELFVVGPTYPQEVDGVNEFGDPKYKRKTGAVKCIWLFSMHKSLDLVEEIRVLNGPYDIHETKTVQIEGQDVEAPMTIEDIRVLYPEHCLGQGIPYIC